MSMLECAMPTASDPFKTVYEPFQRTHNLFMKKVPRGTEACNILVSSVDFVTEPHMILVRLKDSFLLEDFCEIPVPTRFICIFIGPVGLEPELISVGKAMGTLMSDQVGTFYAMT